MLRTIWGYLIYRIYNSRQPPRLSFSKCPDIEQALQQVSHCHGSVNPVASWLAGWLAWSVLVQVKYFHAGTQVFVPVRHQ